MRKKIILCGFGNVGRSFLQHVIERNEEVKRKYGIELIIAGVTGSKGSIYESEGIDIELLLQLGKGSEAILQYIERKPQACLEKMIYDADILIDATPTDLKTGQPALSYILEGMKHGLDIVLLSKGALILHYSEIMQQSKLKNVRIKYSGATAAALPILDIGKYSLAGTAVTSFEGVLNGTTNYILSRMYDKEETVEVALEEAVRKGIAEANPSLDIQGIDTACKLVLLTNQLLGTDYSIKDVVIEGIENVTKHMVYGAKQQGKIFKLIGRFSLENGGARLSVSPTALENNHPLASVWGTNKGATFHTIDMADITVIGGASDPRGAAAAAYKDIINLYIR